MSSAILSPHNTPALSLSDSSASRNARRTTYHHHRDARTGDRDQTTPTHSASSSISTRSQSRQSVSPEKPPGEQPRIKLYTSYTVKPEWASVDREEEEGEPELSEDGQREDSTSVHENGVGGGETSQRGLIPDPRHRSIILTVGKDHARESKKRKSSDDKTPQNLSMWSWDHAMPKGDFKEKNEAGQSREGTSGGVDDDESVQAGDDKMRGADDVARDADMGPEVDDSAQLPSSQLEQTVDTEPAKRAPRKKRKWLKKGEVDPDDPVAVARQKERHKLIDEAMAHLDKQIEMIENDTHPALVWMLEELDRRVSLQLERLEARHEEEMSDLEKMRNVEKTHARFMFNVKREELVQEMAVEHRYTLSRLGQERAALRRIPGVYPVLRDGKGGGGWHFADGPLQSKNEEKLVPVQVGSNKVRRAVSFDVRGYGSEVARQDLAAMMPSKQESPTKLPWSPPNSRRKAKPPAPSPHQDAANHKLRHGQITMTEGIRPTSTLSDRPSAIPSRPSALPDRPPPAAAPSYAQHAKTPSHFSTKLPFAAAPPSASLASARPQPHYQRPPSQYAVSYTPSYLKSGLGIETNSPYQTSPIPRTSIPEKPPTSTSSPPTWVQFQRSKLYDDKGQLIPTDAARERALRWEWETMVVAGKPLLDKKPSTSTLNNASTPSQRLRDWWTGPSVWDTSGRPSPSRGWDTARRGSSPFKDTTLPPFSINRGEDLPAVSPEIKKKTAPEIRPEVEAWVFADREHKREAAQKQEGYSQNLDRQNDIQERLGSEMQKQLEKPKKGSVDTVQDRFSIPPWKPPKTATCEW